MLANKNYKCPITFTGLPISNFTIYYDTAEASISFAAKDLEKILLSKGTNILLKPLAKLPNALEDTYKVLAHIDPSIQSKFSKIGGSPVEITKEQAYALRVTKTSRNKGYRILGGDRVGAMYSAIHLGELVKANMLADVQDENHAPYIFKRGLKFNIPLDIPQPSLGENWKESTSTQTNIANMWEINFWTEYLDVLAKQRYNVLSLCSKHPFPSLVKLDDYPDIALDDV